MKDRPIVLQAEKKPTKHALRMLAVKEYGFQPRVRDPNEALPNQVNKMAGEYKPPNMEPSRSGASQHLTIKSKGHPC